LNDLYRLKKSRTAEEQAWLRFGYDCLGHGQLAAGRDGFALPEAVRQRGVDKPSAGDSATGVSRPKKVITRASEQTPKSVGTSAQAALVVPIAPVVPPASSTCTLRGTAMNSEGRPITNAPIEITGIGEMFASTAMADAAGRFAVDGVPMAGRIRVVLRARGYLDDVRETVGCSVPVALVGKKSNPLGSLFDAARRADRSMQGH
jgi:hypothetical protein